MKVPTRNVVSTEFSARIWAKRNRNGSITIKITDGQTFISTIEEVPGKRCHKHLFRKLKEVLKKSNKWP
jgi:hypothetical protein